MAYGRSPAPSAKAAPINPISEYSADKSAYVMTRNMSVTVKIVRVS